MLFAWLGTIILLCCESQLRADETISKSSYDQHISSARLDLQRYGERRAGALLAQASVRRSLHQNAQQSEGVHKTVSSDFTHQAVLTSYLTNKELETYMQGYVRRCGHMARMFSIGRSKEGRSLLALELSNNVGAVEAKPNARFVGNMHGDEPASRQLLLGLAEWLCQYRTSDDRAARIVNDMHLYLVPTVNPDGFEHRLRHNLGDVDLNRDFPDPLLLGSTGLHPTGDEQPETLAIMKWTTQTHFVASASMHEGAIVANYPWDGSTNPNTSYSASPDDAAFRHLASVYANAHPDMHKSQEFPGGITNGAHWYPLSGGMQDWAYVSGQCMELTVELSQHKWPSEEQLPVLFKANLPAMLAFPLAAAFSGLRGSVHGRLVTLGGNTTDLDKPLPATINVEGIDHAIQAGVLGDYYRPLAPGTYNVSAVMKGYSAVSTQVMLPSNGAGVVHDFVLPCTTCQDEHGQAEMKVAYIEEGSHMRTAVYAFVAVAGGGWLLCSLWLWQRARTRRWYQARKSRATSV